MTTLDATTALVVIDLQQGLVALPTVHPADAVVRHARALADAFRRHGLPVVLVTVAGGPPGRTEQPRLRGELPAGWDELVPELTPQPGDHRVTKRTPGAFTHTGLDAYLRGRGVTQLVIAGVATSNGVEATARQGYELGYHVALAVDAMTDRSTEAHQHSVTRIFPRLGETGTTEAIIRLLDSRTPAGPGGA